MQVRVYVLIRVFYGDDGDGGAAAADRHDGGEDGEDHRDGNGDRDPDGKIEYAHIETMANSLHGQKVVIGRVKRFDDVEERGRGTLSSKNGKIGPETHPPLHFPGPPLSHDISTSNQ